MIKHDNNDDDNNHDNNNKDTATATTNSNDYTYIVNIKPPVGGGSLSELHKCIYCSRVLCNIKS